MKDFNQLVDLAKSRGLEPRHLRAQIRCVADGLAEAALGGDIANAVGFLLENEDCLCHEEDTVESVILGAKVQ